MITVTNNNDSGAGSLRQAVLDAAAGEEIQFSITGVITLTSGQIQINQSVIITGPGSADLRITNNPLNARAFEILGGPTTITGLTFGPCAGTEGGALWIDATTTLDDIIFSICSASVDGGGGLYNQSTVFMTNCSFANCSATTVGGAIHNNGGTIYDSPDPATTIVIENCTANTDGGGIYNSGTLNLQFGHISGCQAGANGGGIYNSGTVQLVDYTIDNNSAPTNGDGIFNSFGTVTFTRSTLSNNVFTGLYNSFGTFIMDNSTVSGNGDTGLYNALGAFTINHSTIASNTQYGVIQDNGSVLTIQNTILAGNGIEDLTSETADVTSSGNNIFGVTSNPVTPGPDDQMGVATVDLHLGVLQDNGGPTFTMALETGSVALEAGNSTGAPATDQRGDPRVAGVEMDIGAYEATINCLTFTGTLPGWLTIQGDCLVVTPGSFRGATKAAANAAAQAALDSFVAEALASGDLVCNS